MGQPSPIEPKPRDFSMENLPESPFTKSTLGSSSSSTSQKNPIDLGALTLNQLVLLIYDASLREDVMHNLYKVYDTFNF
ncbi:hypothetical protein H5410_038011 [Solanum commersonii]|uniref:Uncharacterized protein n=1 Tax=Solanum commersonii TaxID=4109 RepID=A0A9J5Y7U4_SOLCO|nr:hypothetical protein H5410_038011 [Solanum commersonii]